MKECYLDDLRDVSAHMLAGYMEPDDDCVKLMDNANMLIIG